MLLGGGCVSSSLYWLGDRAARYRDLTRLAPRPQRCLLLQRAMYISGSGKGEVGLSWDLL